MSPWLRAGLAGAAAAGVWGLVEPIDRRLFRFSYSDIALLGKLVTRGPHWRAVGWVVHIVNGAVAGLVFWTLYEWFGGNAFWFAICFAMVEHLVTYPLTMIVDRRHPARGAPELPPMSRSGRAFARRCSATCYSVSCWACSSRSKIPAPGRRTDSGMRRGAVRETADDGDDPVAEPLSEAMREPTSGPLELGLVVEHVGPRRPRMSEACRPHEPDEGDEDRGQADGRLALEKADQRERRVPAEIPERDDPAAVRERVAVQAGRGRDDEHQDDDGRPEDGGHD